MANKPVLHRRDHEHGGADPVRIVWESTGEAGEGGAIMFDTTPQEGGFLQITADTYINIETSGSDPLNIGADGTGDVSIYNGDGDVNIGGGHGLVDIVSRGEGIVIDASGDGDIVIDASSAGATAPNSIILRGHSTHGNLVIIQGIPTSDPGVAGALWNNSGTLMISP